MPRSHNVRARAAALCAGLLAGAIPTTAPAQTAAAAAQASPAPVRTLVYAFESRPAAPGDGPDNGGYGDPAGEISPDDCLTGGLKISGRMSAGIDLANGGIDWFQVDCKGGFGHTVEASRQLDRGTITVDMLGNQTDGSLVVRVTQSPGQRDDSAATCVVFSTTAIVCDPNKTISLEEVTLIRFLAPDVVESNHDQTHWKLQEDSPQASFQATYSVLQIAGGMMTIDERRSAKGEAGPYSTDDSSSKFTYDVARAVPTAIVDSLVQKTVRYGKYLTMQRATIFQLLPAASR